MRNYRSKVRQGKGFRAATGSVLFVVIATICLLIVPMIILSSQFGMLLVDKTRVQNIIEAAGLLAANDFSRIVINDPNFGFVSLSNYAPVGKGTLASDGEPLPVWGINTLSATIRQNAIVAKEINNVTMASLAQDDRLKLQTTIEQLNKALNDGLSATGKPENFDISGSRVEIYKDVSQFLKTNLPPNVEIESVKLSNGWLTDGARTTIAVPQPVRLAEVKSTEVQQGFLKPFIDIPVSGQKYTFAGLGAASTIVLPTGFKPADREHICSIVKIECVLKIHRPGGPLGGGDAQKMVATACCQPYSLPDAGPGGVMTLRFTAGPVDGLQSWSDLLSGGNFKDRQISCYDVVGGDYQIDKDARKRALMPKLDNSTAHEFSENLYYWLRSGHVRPRLDALSDMLNESFKMGPKDLYAYEFANDGTISRRIVDRDPFPIGATSDCQFSTLADTRIQGDRTPIIIFRNNVKRLGTMYGGKHAGQPLSGIPDNWCELREYGGGEQLAAKLGRGRLGTGLIMDNPTSRDAANNPFSNIFRNITGTVALQPRRSFYSGGLALDIEIGGMRPSTAYLDIERMHKLKR